MQCRIRVDEVDAGQGPGSLLSAKTAVTLALQQKPQHAHHMPNHASQQGVCALRGVRARLRPVREAVERLVVRVAARVPGLDGGAVLVEGGAAARCDGGRGRRAAVLRRPGRVHRVDRRPCADMAEPPVRSLGLSGISLADTQIHFETQIQMGTQPQMGAAGQEARRARAGGAGHERGHAQLKSARARARRALGLHARACRRRVEGRRVRRARLVEVVLGDVLVKVGPAAVCRDCESGHLDCNTAQLKAPEC